MDDDILLPLIDQALEEDLPDITTNAIFDPDEKGSAHVLVKENGIIAGLRAIELTLRALDPSAEVELLAADGDPVEAGTIVARAAATIHALLGAERTILNLMQRASGVATLTHRFVEAVRGFDTQILDTRKTIPGLRLLDKAAVVAGGGTNHRLGLHDMFLIKDNHVDGAGGITNALRKVRKSGLDKPVMVEVRSLGELDEVLELEPEMILLDNMSLSEMAEAVRRRNSRTSPPILLEASGGVSLETVRSIAACGVDRISIGALTHSASALDISMKIDR